MKIPDCEIEDTAILEREIPKFILKVENIKPETFEKSFLELATRDQESFIEIILFVNFLDRCSSMFRKIGNAHFKSMKDRKYRTFYDNIVEGYTKNGYDAYIKLGPKAFEIYKDLLSEKYNLEG